MMLGEKKVEMNSVASCELVSPTSSSIVGVSVEPNSEKQNTSANATP